MTFWISQGTVATAFTGEVGKSESFDVEFSPDLIYQKSLKSVYYVLRESYCGHARLCVCVSVCLSVCPRPYAHTTARTRM